MTRPLATLDHAVLATARGITRRRLLRRAGSGAFGLLVAGAFFSRTAEEAFADQVACSAGGIPVCSSTRCYSNGTCHNTLQTRPAYHNTGTCTTSNHCWLEQPANCIWQCCDCCVNYNTGFEACNSCAGIYWGCACRAILAC